MHRYGQNIELDNSVSWKLDSQKQATLLKSIINSRFLKSFFNLKKKIKQNKS